MFKKIIKNIIPLDLLNYYHKALAIIAKFIYGRPSEKMIIIGVTGTNGKSTTVMLTAKILETAGYQAGATSTALFKIGEKEWLNDKKMTMPGRFVLQKMLHEMVEADCQYAVIETSSEGIKQFRHLGIHYDVCVFTNLTPEHLESHGGFSNYKKAKLELFKKLEKESYKVLSGELPPPRPANAGRPPSGSDIRLTAKSGSLRDRGGKIDKVIVANGDDEQAEDFLDFKVDEKYIYQILNSKSEIPNKFKIQNSKFKILEAERVNFKKDGISFAINNIKFNLKLFGLFNVYNALAAISVASSQGINLEICKAALEKIENIPGRVEFINEGQFFKVLVDYAPEPESMRQLYQTIKDHHFVDGGKIIHVLGSAGGGRDKARRPILGELAAKNVDYVIITNEDPYDDDPMEIISEVAAGAIEAGKKLDNNLFKILDRREAIKKALSLAQESDLVLLTGKGSEQAICVAGGKKIPWDEREVAREMLKLKVQSFRQRRMRHWRKKLKE